MAREGGADLGVLHLLAGDPKNATVRSKAVGIRQALVSRHLRLRRMGRLVKGGSRCAYVAAVLAEYGTLNHRGLLETVHERYRAYATKSRLREKICRKG